MNRLLMLVCAVLLTLPLHAQNLEGSWTGKLDLGAMQLNLVFRFAKAADGQWTATLDSPDQGAKGIPATVEQADSAKVSVAVPSIGATYEGSVSDGELQGTFRQSGYAFPLRLKPGTVTRLRPQTPQPPYPYTTEEVTFSNTEAGAELAATLTLPVGYDRAKAVPVVIMVTGSGPQNRDEELFDHKPFLVLADYLARHGIASLRYDDRGTAQSTGHFVGATTADFKQDAAAGLQWLRAQGKRFARVGVLGHSEGATVAFMLASEGLADFVVALAAPALRGDTILALQTNQEMERQGQPLRVTAQRIRQQVIAGGDAWQKFFVDYDPATAIAATRCPVMAVYGTKDRQVFPELSFPVIEAKLPKNSHNLLKRYDGLNHLLQHCATGYVDEYAQIEETLSPDVLNDVAQWIGGLDQ